MSFSRPPVQRSHDFVRIQKLPVRTEKDYPPNLVEEMTKLLKTPNGTQKLFEVQARALYDLGTYKHLCAPLSVGCHRAGQGILLADGSVKVVENIVVGDILAGYSGPRTVRELHRGEGQMYKIVPVKGAPWVVNEDHVLTLIRTARGHKYPCQAEKLFDISVRDFLLLPASSRADCKLLRSGPLLFPPASKPTVDPYFLGLLLGDGTLSGGVGVTTQDPEIWAEVYRQALVWGLTVRVHDSNGTRCPTYFLTAGREGGHARNGLREALRDLSALNGCEDKHVPASYKTGDVATRARMLAGLIDSDGSLTVNGYDFISKARRLAEDVVFISRSLGLAAYLTICQKRAQTGPSRTYYRVSISGDVFRVPCRLRRKQAGIREQKKDVLRTGFTLEKLGVEPYYGFELDGDRRYLLDDFTVTHNCGKTLVSFLAPRMLQVRNPVLLVPAALLQKTDREWRAAAEHWKVAKHLKFMSYEKLGRVSGANMLDTVKPEMIIGDEIHKIKNLRAAVTKRVTRYMAAYPKTVFIPMSGTMMKGSVRDFAHLWQWSHRDMSPLPVTMEHLDEWAGALDEGLNPVARRSAGVLLDLFPGTFGEEIAALNATDESLDETERDARRARQIFFRRASATPGMVFSSAKESYPGSLQINAVEYTVNAATEANFVRLRGEMCRPDGWALSDAMQVWAVARQLALGLHYEWNPSPPQDWLDARKQWASFVREYLASPQSVSHGIDSELQVTTAVLNGQLPDTYDLLATWQRIKPSFDINSVPVWHDRTALELCAKWLDKTPGICWVEHKFFGRELSKLTGVPYFGAKGLDPRGNFIQDASGPIIASIAANSAGRNLQAKWSQNLVTAPPADSERWEQMIARTHRYGQTADEVTVDVLVGCREHLESIPRALSSATVKADLLGSAQKLRVADISWPDAHGHNRKGLRWA